MLYARHGRPVFIAVPAYSGLSAGTAFSLFEADTDDAEIAILPGRCHVDDARNELIAAFLASGAEDLVFVDADTEFSPHQLKRLLEHDADIVAGVAPRRTGQVGYCVDLPAGEVLQADAQGLLTVDGVGAAFLRIRRRVLEVLAADAQKHPVEGQVVPIIFERTFEDGVRWGGDYTFCRKARAHGAQVKVDPEIWLKHGEREGSLGAFLRKKNMIGMGHALQRIRDASGIPDDAERLRILTEACGEVHEYWCNAWACNVGTLVTLAMLAPRANRILEAGSGLSTLVMAAANPHADIHVLEDQSEWLDRLRTELDAYGLGNRVVIWSTPERLAESDWWYTAVPSGIDFDLVFVDGPAFHVEGVGVNTETRRGIYSDLAWEIRNAILVIDDADHYPDIVQRYERRQVVGERLAICLPNQGKEKAA